MFLHMLMMNSSALAAEISWQLLLMARDAAYGTIECPIESCPSCAGRPTLQFTLFERKHLLSVVLHADHRSNALSVDRMRDPSQVVLGASGDPRFR
jgi:hypothetical protein